MVNFSRGATPAATIKSVIASATLTMAWQRRAAQRSQASKNRRAPLPCHGWNGAPWTVWITAGTPNDQAAARPSRPALPLCVWTTSGWNQRNTRFNCQ